MWVCLMPELPLDFSGFIYQGKWVSVAGDCGGYERLSVDLGGLSVGEGGFLTG